MYFKEIWKLPFLYPYSLFITSNIPWQINPYGSFINNFEWAEEMNPQAFGAFTMDGTLKEGSKAYVNFLSSWKNSIQ